MNKIIGLTIGALVIAIIALAIGLMVKTPVVNVNPAIECPECALGVSAGPEHWNTQVFHDGLMIGDKVYSTSTTDTSATLLAANLKDTVLINFTPSKDGITLTLPATSTLSDWIKTTGTSHTMMFCSGTTTNGTTADFTLAQGTGMNLHYDIASSTTFYAGGCARMSFYRASDTDIEFFLEQNL